MGERISIYLDGYAPERERDLVERLSRISRFDAETLKQMLRTGPVRLAEAVDRTVAERFRRFLEPLEAELRFEPHPSASSPTSTTGVGSPPPAVPGATDPAHSPEPEPRPLGFRRRLAWSLALVRRNALTLLALILLSVASLLIVPAAMVLGFGIQAAGALGPALAGLPLALMTGPPLALIGIAGGMLTFMLVMFWLYAALLQVPAVSMAHGARAPLKTVLRQGLQRTPDLITALGIAALLPLPLQIASGASGLLVSGTAGLGLQVVIMLALIWLGLSLALAGPVAALEGVGPVAAIRRAWTLVRGHRLRLIGNLLLFAAVGVILLLGASAPGFAAADSAAVAIVSALLMLLVTTTFLLAGLFFIVDFYFEARVLGEGWRPTWLESPEPSWPLSREIPEPPAGRGARAWGELALFGLACAALLALFLSWLPAQFPGSGAAALPRPVPGVTSPRADPKPAQPAAGDPSLSAELSNFFAGESPSVWVEVELTGALAELPPEADIPVTVQVASVEGPNGEALYDPEHGLEDTFFHTVSLQSRGDGRRTGIRNVRLREGTTDESVSRLSGTAEIAIPRGLRSAQLSPAAPQATVAGLDVSLEVLEGPRADLVIRGEDVDERWFALFGEGPDGPVEPQSRSRSPQGEQLTVSYYFAEPVSAVRITAAVRMERQRFALALKRHHRERFPLGE